MGGDRQIHDRIATAVHLCAHLIRHHAVVQASQFVRLLDKSVASYTLVQAVCAANLGSYTKAVDLFLAAAAGLGTIGGRVWFRQLELSRGEGLWVFG